MQIINIKLLSILVLLAYFSIWIIAITIRYYQINKVKQYQKVLASGEKWFRIEYYEKQFVVSTSHVKRNIILLAKAEAEVFAGKFADVEKTLQRTRIPFWSVLKRNYHLCLFYYHVFLGNKKDAKRYYNKIGSPFRQDAIHCFWRGLLAYVEHNYILCQQNLHIYLIKEGTKTPEIASCAYYYFGKTLEHMGNVADSKKCFSEVKRLGTHTIFYQWALEGAV